MATETIELSDITTGQTGLTAKLFAQGSDTVVATLSPVTERTNCKSSYRVDTTAGLTGWHRIIVFDSGGTALGGWWVNLTNTVTVTYARNEIPQLAADILTTQMTESYSADGTAPTLAQSLFLIQQYLTEKSIAGTTLTVKRLNGSTTAFTVTLNSATNPTAATRAT